MVNLFFEFAFSVACGFLAVNSTHLFGREFKTKSIKANIVRCILAAIGILLLVWATKSLLLLLGNTFSIGEWNLNAILLWAFVWGFYIALGVTNFAMKGESSETIADDVLNKIDEGQLGQVDPQVQEKIRHLASTYSPADSTLARTEENLRLANGMARTFGLVVIGVALSVLIIGFWTWFGQQQVARIPAGTRLPMNLSDIGTIGDMYGGFNALFAALAFAGVVFTIGLQMRELGLQRKEFIASRLAQQKLAEAAAEERIDRALELFETFRFKHMSEARTKAWKVRTKWFTDPDYRENCRNTFFRFHGHGRNFDENLRSVYDLLEFYGLLALHKGNDELIREMRFYYEWWRGFLLEFTQAINEEYDNLNLNVNEQAQFPKPIYSQLLEKFERKLGNLPEYAKDLHCLDRVLVDGIDASQFLPPEPQQDPNLEGQFDVTGKLVLQRNE